MEKPLTEILAVDQCGRVCVVTLLTRELNATAAEELSTRLLSLLNDAKHYRFVLDFGHVQYMESSCFGALVNFLRWLSRFDGKIAIANVTENVRFLFAVTKLDKVFPIMPDVATALDHVERSAK
jgi:anti-sigma B factor antagonist